MFCFAKEMMRFFYSLSTEKSIFLIAVFLALFIFIPVYYFVGEKALSPGGADSTDHHILADNLLNHGVFSMKTEAPFTPSARELPAYAFLLALSKYAFGNSIGVILLQIFAFAGLVVLTYRIAIRVLQKERLALITALLYVAESYTLFMTLTVMNDILFTFFLVFSLWLFICFIDYNETKILISSFAALGVSILFRPVGGIVFPFYTAVILYRAHRNPKLRRQEFIKLAYGFFLLFLFIAPWALRNYYYFGTLRLTPTDAYNLYVFPAKRIQALADGVPFYASLSEYRKKFEAVFEAETDCTVFESWDSFGCIQWMQDRSLAIFRQHPVRLAEVVILGTVNQITKTQWNNPWVRWKILPAYPAPHSIPLREIFYRFSPQLLMEQLRVRAASGFSFLLTPLLLVLGRLFWIAAILLAIVGAYALWKQNTVPKPSLLLIYLFLTTYSLSHGLLLTSIDVSQRVNLPTYPFFLTLAVAGFMYVKNISKTAKTL